MNLKVLQQKEEEYLLKIDDENQAQEILKELINRNSKIRKFEMKKPSLNEIFIEKVGEVQ